MTAEIVNNMVPCERFYNHLIEQAAQRFSLTKIELDVLLFLHNNPPYDTARDICVRRMIAKSYVSKAVELLRQKRLLALTPDGADRRVTHLRILPAAQEAVQAGLDAQAQFQAQLWKDIPDAQRKIFQDTLMQIRSNVQEGL